MIADPPPLLYITGTLTEQDELAVAIVGARRATAAGRAMTEELSHDLAGAGMTVVSGLARGVDAAAHRGALAAQGRTIAVLGCGIDRTYPPEHERLRRQIEERGAILSEVPMGAPPHGHHFPRRNRIISGLSLGVIVTEAAINSGSLITARLAAEQGREVFAVPGFVKEDTSRGTNALAQRGRGLDRTRAGCHRRGPAAAGTDAAPAPAAFSREERTWRSVWAKRNSGCMMSCHMTRSQWTT